MHCDVRARASAGMVTDADSLTHAISATLDVSDLR
jgi:hypothetical protein